MRFSIIIPTLNEESQIEGTLTALKSLPGDKEIIVADGGSSDRTQRVAARCGVRVLESPRGRGTQMRAGAAEALGSVLWFVHADTRPLCDALTEISRALADKRVVGGNFGLLFDGPSRAARQLTLIYPCLRLLGLSYGDSGLFIRRNVYERIGGFRPIALFEDLDLLRRMKREGRFVHLQGRMLTSSRRFEDRNFALVWLRWTTLQVFYWLGVPGDVLARWYSHSRETTNA